MDLGKSSSLLLLLCKIVDLILLIFFSIIAIVAPLFDAQTCLPSDIFPKILLDLKSQYGNKFNDTLIMEKPNFFVGLVWVEILFQWPLAIASIYGLLAGKQWFRTSCLLYGVSAYTSMGAIFGELILSGKASKNLLMIYFPFLGFSLLAISRGLLPTPEKEQTLLVTEKKGH